MRISSFHAFPNLIVFTLVVVVVIFGVVTWHNGNIVPHRSTSPVSAVNLAGNSIVASYVPVAPKPKTLNTNIHKDIMPLLANGRSIYLLPIPVLVSIIPILYWEEARKFLLFGHTKRYLLFSNIKYTAIVGLLFVSCFAFFAATKYANHQYANEAPPRSFFVRCYFYFSESTIVKLLSAILSVISGIGYYLTCFGIPVVWALWILERGLYSATPWLLFLLHTLLAINSHEYHCSFLYTYMFYYAFALITD